ncbi:MAG: 3'-5' exonuclease [Patescibacteria group bacterium]|nr:3'-5' exonuclease [Patescibacteria group bacterium]
MNFNPAQQNIINNIWGAYLISAPVGTGKTTVLTERIIRALKEGVRPDEVLAMTFTNRAADEMKNRIKERIDDKNDFDSLTISTFHGFCAYFIKSEADNIGISSDFLVLDEDEQLEIAKDIFIKSGQSWPDKPREILNILENFYKYRLSIFQIEMGHKIKAKQISPEIIIFGEEYLNKMSEQNSLDFNELVFITLKTLMSNKEISEKWSKRFRFIQLDEFQDTHISEYLVVKELAKRHKNIALIGDIDQTIYSFRDSQPVFIAKLFKDHFSPVKEFDLNINYRSNPTLIEAFMSILKNMNDSRTKEINSGVIVKKEKDENDESSGIKLFKAYNFSEEVSWIIDNIKKIKEKNPQAKIVVLNRANYLISKVAKVFLENNISFLTVDQYDFFKRQEIKDIFSYLKILFNKADIFSAQRIIERSAKNIGKETIKKIYLDGRNCGLNLSDFLNFKNYNFSEPFSELVNYEKSGRIIVLDTETTGINPASDEIVQIYAREIIDGKLGEEFHFYLKNKKSVGSSYFVHKISDEFLAEKGRDPKKILKDLKKFIGNSAVAGHNVLFDLNMIKENSKRLGIDIDFNNYYDTLDLSRRFLNLASYKLSNIAKHLNFQTATHSADDDVGATIELLFYLIKQLKSKSEERIALWNKFKAKFLNISLDINNWEKEVDKKRPVELLSHIWQVSGLRDLYEKDKNAQQRQKSFETLKTFFENRDNKKFDARSSLHNLIHFAGLVKNIDFLGLDQGKIPIVTVHQVKGLEFDYVFLLGLNEGIFPLFKSDNLEEEKRLFYVALTRAKQGIFLSCSNFNDYNYPISKSRLVSLIDPKFVTEI